MVATLACGAIGCLLGFLQSLLVGIYGRSWSGGTGALWGIISGAVSAILAGFLGWNGMYAAVLLPTTVGAVSILSVFHDRQRNQHLR